MGWGWKLLLPAVFLFALAAVGLQDLPPASWALGAVGNIRGWVGVICGFGVFMYRMAGGGGCNQRV
jgi:hypothetical protein